MHTIFEIEDKEITLSEKGNTEVNKKINIFVNALKEKNQSIGYYAKKRNTTIGKATDDNFLGKKAEVFAWKYLVKQRGFPKIKVDIEIRSGYHKGWKADLLFHEKDINFPNVHVKACQQNMVNWIGDYSWTFQISNNDGIGGKDAIFNGSDNDLVAFVFIEDPEASKAIIKAIMPWGEIKKYLKDPKKLELKGLKKCVYYRDLPKTHKYPSLELL
jgi:hypothetical protein